MSVVNAPINSEPDETTVFGKTDTSRKAYLPSKCILIWIIVVLVLAVLLLILASVLPIIVHNMVHKQIEEQVPLRENGSLTYSSWVSPPAPIFMQYWFFDVQNADEVVKSGAKPLLQQVGPITYQERRKKVDIVFHENNGSVSYREIKTFHYVPEMSAINESHPFTNINIPLLVVANMVRDKYSIFHSLIESIFETLDGSGLFVKKTAKEVLWGYEDPAIHKINTIIEKVGLHLDPNVGIFYGKNGTDDGRYNVFSGTVNLGEFVHIHTWKDQEELSIWSTSVSNQINGTDGTMFGPFVDASARQYIFASDLCRSIYVEFEEHSSVRDVPSYLYTSPPSVFANVSENPDNLGFCIPNCLGAGLLNMSHCIPQAPVIMSPPHFYDTDPNVLALVDGLTPSVDDRTEIEVEPNTGVVVSAKKKLQINMAIQPVSGFSDMDKINPSLILPYLWLNESALIDEASAAQMRNTIVLASRASKAVSVAFNVIGILLLIALLLVCAFFVYRWFTTYHTQGHSSSNTYYTSRQNLLANDRNPHGATEA